MCSRLYIYIVCVHFKMCTYVVCVCVHVRIPCTLDRGNQQGQCWEGGTAHKHPGMPHGRHLHKEYISSVMADQLTNAGQVHKQGVVSSPPLTPYIQGHNMATGDESSFFRLVTQVQNTLFWSHIIRFLVTAQGHKWYSRTIDTIP